MTKLNVKKKCELKYSLILNEVYTSYFIMFFKYKFNVDKYKIEEQLSVYNIHR